MPKTKSKTQQKKGGFLGTVLRTVSAVRLGTKAVKSMSNKPKSSHNRPQNSNKLQKTVRVIDPKNNSRFTIRSTNKALKFYTHGNSNTPVGEMHRNNIKNIAVNNNTLKITKTNNSSFTYKIANNSNSSHIKQNLSA